MLLYPTFIPNHVYYSTLGTKLGINHKIIPEENNVISKLFPKWCNSGVVSAFPIRETIDFTGFSGHP